MSRPVSRARIVGVILKKDAHAFTRDRLWMFLTAFALVAFVGIFWILPDKVDETITVGVYPPSLAESLTALSEAQTQDAEGDQAGAAGQPEEAVQGLEVVTFDSVEELSDIISGEKKAEGKKGDVSVGLAFPEDFVAKVASGQRATVQVFVDASVPAEVRDAMSSAVREIAYFLAAAAGGRDPETALPVREQTVVLGEDRAGDQVTLQQKMRPMLAFIVLMMESMALGSLITIEVQQRTVTALLVTPARLSDILASKSILGTTIAFGEAVIVLALTRSFSGSDWSVLLVAVLLGGIIATSVALISGSAGRDFMGTLFLGVAFLIPLAIPAFTALFPGTPAWWVQALPTYGVIEALVGATAYGQSWTDLWNYVALAAVWCMALFGLGLFVLRRRVRTL